jgi:predicted secreted acid phosphatase
VHIKANPTRLTTETTAFVFDLDDTVLFVTEDDDRKHPCQKKVHKLRGMMRQLVEACQRFGRVFFVTAREANKEVADWTRDELRKAGFSGWERIFYCPRRMRRNWDTIAQFKRNARRQIERMKDKSGKPLNYRIVLSVGDKWTDLIADVDTLKVDRHDAGKAWFTLATVTNPSQHTVLALKLPSR